MRHYKLVLLLSLSLFLIVGLFAQNNIGTGFSPSQIDEPSIERNMIPAATYMQIDSDAGFEPAGFTGSGTEGDPYVLDGEIIELGSGDMGIRIFNTKAHFVISNCTFSTIGEVRAERAIELTNADNGTVENCIMQGKYIRAFSLSGSDDLQILGNEIHGCTAGFDLYSGTRVNITNNRILDSRYFGIHAWAGSNITIENNWIHRVELSGTVAALYIQADNVSVIGNDIRNVVGQGIYANNAENLTIQNNRIWDVTEHGIYIITTDTAGISFNNISCVQKDGIHIGSGVIGIFEVHNNTVHHGGPYGIYTEVADDGLYYGNKVFQFGTGIAMAAGAHNNRIYDNQLGWNWDNNTEDAGTTVVYNDWGWTYGNLYHDYTTGDYPIGSSPVKLNDTNPQTLVDSTTPTIERPGYSFEFWDTDTDIWLTWTAEDDFPSHWMLYTNSSSGDPIDWCNDTISISLDDYDVGGYRFSILVVDCAATPHHDQSLDVYVTIKENDITSPDITPHSDFSEEAFSDSFYINWTAYDLHPANYEIYNNGTPLKENIYSDGDNLWWSPLIPADYLGKGLHNFTIFANDTFGNTATSTTWVTVVDTTVPTITGLTLDHDAEYGIDSVNVTYSVEDYYPNRKMVWLNDSLVVNTTWSDGPDSIDFGYLSLGEYNITIVYTDEDGNSNKGTCIVTVVDTTDPVVSSPPDVYMELGEIGNWINWTIDEPHPDYYEAWINGTSYGTNAYSGSFNMPCDEADVGEYNVTLVFFDTEGNFAVDTVWVFVTDTTDPAITGPVDFSYEGGASSIVSWSWDELEPENYTVYVNGTEMEFGETFSGDIQYTIDEQTLGIWNVTLVIYDESGNFGTDEVWVTVVDTTVPVVSGDDDQEINDVDSIQLNWTCTDLYPDSYVLYQNGSSVLNDDWDGSDITYLVNLTAGVYNFTLVISDTSGNSAMDTVMVTIIDTSTTSTTTTTTTTTPTTTTTTDTTPTSGTTDTTLPPDDGGAMAIVLVLGVIGAIVVIVVILFVLPKLKK